MPRIQLTDSELSELLMQQGLSRSLKAKLARAAVASGVTATVASAAGSEELESLNASFGFGASSKLTSPDEL